MKVTELHLHTQYSLLDGLNTADEYMQRASELGMTHLAITDHGTLSGHRDFQIAAKKHNITPLLGVEAYISATGRDDRRPMTKRDDNTQAFNHLGIIAQNEEGLTNLNRLSEIAWTEGFYNRPRIDMEVLEEYSGGLIVLSGCLNGLISKAIENDTPAVANQYMREFKRIFGDRFFIEIQGHNPDYINKGLLDLANKYNVLPVVTSDCHYARKEDLWKEEAMLILSTSPDLQKGFDFAKSQKMDILERFNYLYPNRKMTFQEIEIYLRDVADHKAMLAAQGIGDEPIKNTMVVAGMVETYPFYQNLDLLPLPKTDDPDELLRKKVIAGAKKKGTYGSPAHDARREEELGIIAALGFSPYMIMVANIVAWAKSKGIRVGPGRGSAAGSLICYETDITMVDPVVNNLLFFRFINPERNDKPDIDIDIEDRRRHEVKDYARRQYKYVASIATYGTWGGKKAIRDAARVFKVPLGEVNKALKGADWPIDWFDSFRASEKGKAFCKKYPEVLELAQFLEGRIRERGMHAGGLVVAREPINKYAPMETASDPNDKSAPRVPLVAMDMDHVADIGLIKQDALGLKALSVVEDTLQMIRDRHGKDIDLETMTYDDPKVYEMISSGYTKGVFQCEQVPYTGLIFKMNGVKNFTELIASNALVRPGAANSTAGQDFIDRKEGKKPVRYLHPLMQPFTEETYGTVIYQEQVMLTMTELAGMSMATADKVRKIIGKKKDVSEFEQYKAEFIEGASKNVSERVAERLWKDFEAHAGYSFNKSHAQAYSMLSYWTAWLKVYYPLEFMCAVLRNEKDKDAKLDYLIETKRLGIRVKLPHVNDSDIYFKIGSDEKGDYIRFGLSDIKGISGKLGVKIVNARPFESYKDLETKATQKYTGFNRALASLNAIGAASFPDNPRTGNEPDNYYEYLNIPAFGGEALPPRIVTMLRPMEEYSEDEVFIICGMVRKIKTGDTWSRVEFVDETGSAAAFSTPDVPIETGQMYVALIANNSIAKYASKDDIIAGKGGDFYEFLNAPGFPDIPDGMVRVVSFNTRKTKKGERMANVVFSTNEKELQPALIWPSMWPQAHTHLKEGEVVDVIFNETKDGTVFVDRIL